MHYLKVTAQDRGGNGKADVVHLHFHQGPDHLLHEAIAFDLNDNGAIDFGVNGDLNSDGFTDFNDQQLLQAFASTFFKLNWFNTGDNWERHVRFSTRDYYHDGKPNSVNLQLREDDGTPGKPIDIQIAATYDGRPDLLSKMDLNHDGSINKADERLLSELAALFLKMRWHPC